MMKLVISFDEIDSDFQEFCPAFPEDVINAEEKLQTMRDKIYALVYPKN